MTVIEHRLCAAPKTVASSAVRIPEGILKPTFELLTRFDCPRAKRRLVEISRKVLCQLHVRHAELTPLVPYPRR